MRFFVLLAVLMAGTHAALVVRPSANEQEGALDGLDLRDVAASNHHDGISAQHIVDNALPATHANANNRGQVPQAHGTSYLVGTRRP